MRSPRAHGGACLNFSCSPVCCFDASVAVGSWTLISLWSPLPALFPLSGSLVESREPSLPSSASFVPWKDSLGRGSLFLVFWGVLLHGWLLSALISSP